MGDDPRRIGDQRVGWDRTGLLDSSPMTTTRATRNNSWHVLRHRDLRFAVLASFLAATASTMQVSAIGFVLYRATGSKADLGLLGLAEFLPSFLLVLITGSFADRHSRRLIAVVALSVEVVVAVGLVVGVHRGITTVAPFLIAALLYGTAKAFQAPATRPLIAMLCPPEELQAAIPIGSLSWQSASIVGPVLGGILAGWRAEAAFAAVGLVYAGAVVALLLIPSERTRVKRLIEEQPTLSHALEGLRLIRTQPVVFGAISLDLMAVLFGGAVALLPAVARDMLHVGGGGYGLLRASTGIGGVMMGLILAAKPLNGRVGRVLLVAVGVFGICTVVLGLSHNYVLSFMMLLVLSAADMVSVYIRGTLVPLATPDELRGRVTAVEQVFIGASNELGAFESGFAAAWLGLAPAIVLGGVATLVVVGVWWAFFPKLRDVDHFMDVVPVPVAGAVQLVP